MGEPPNLPPPPSAPPSPYQAAPAWSPPGQPWGYPYGQPAPRHNTTEPFAIVSLVASLAGFVVCFVGPVVGIVFGHIARSRIKSSGANGAGMALAGIIIGYVQIAAAVVAIVVITIIAVNSGGDASHAARRLHHEIQVIAERSGTSPRDGDVVRRAIREAGIGDENVLVGSTNENAVVATTDELAFEGWRLEIHQAISGKSCLSIPPTVTSPPVIHDGSCPGF